MIITYQEARKYTKDIETPLEEILESLHKNLVEKREEGIPIYLMKYRLKKVDSIYLKTKRKNVTDLKTIEDYAGLRILCLFEQDIYIVNKCLLALINSLAHYTLKEIMTYNWPEHKTKNIFSPLGQLGIESKKTQEMKESGYKSIHYIVNVNHRAENYPVEIQLRTLLQDVWGELEHNLSYKQGSVHPHIKKSFVLLSQDLSTNDSLIKHLKDIRDKENSGHVFSLKKVRPFGYMTYEDNIFPEILNDELYKKKFEKYSDHIREHLQKDGVNHDKHIREAHKLLKDVVAKMPYAVCEESNMHYWLKMEEAYLDFHGELFDKSMETYEDLRRSRDDCGNSKYYCRPVLHFRIGELHFINNNLEKALAAFDASESCLQESNVKNRFRIKIKLAYIYWLLGEEYFSIVIEMIKEAENIFDSNRQEFDDTDHMVLINGGCWYYLDSYINFDSKEKTLLGSGINKCDQENPKLDEIRKLKEEHYLKSTDYYGKLEESLATKEFDSNIYDTAAWFCYKSYLRTDDLSWLSKAKDNCIKVQEHKNRATLKMKSHNIQMNHMLEIMSKIQETDLAR